MVTRQFGGTELGVGGLDRANGRAVSMAVDDAGVIEREPRPRVTVEVDYDDSGTVRGLLETAGIEFDAAYEKTVEFDVRFSVDEAKALLDRLRGAAGGRAIIELVD